MDRVLLINDFYLGGGAEGVFRDTFDVLKKANIEVDVFYGEEKACHPKSVISYFYNKKNKNDLMLKLNSFKPSVIHIHNYYHYLSSSIFIAIKQYKKTHKVKVVFTAHDYHLICPSSGMTAFKDKTIQPLLASENIFIKTFFKCLDYRGFKYSMVKKMQWYFENKIVKSHKCIDQIISPSIFLKEMFVKSGIKISIKVIRNPMNLIVPNNINNLKTPLEKEIRILFIGRLSQEKGLEEFINAYSKIKSKGVFLDVLGTGLEEKKLKSIVSKQKLKNVTFHGFKQGNVLKEFLIKSNVLLLSSIWYENAPLSIIEGASYGNVILTSNLGGMAELTKLTKSYILVDDWDKELESSIAKLSLLETNRVKNPTEFISKYYLEQLLNTYNH